MLLNYIDTRDKNGNKNVINMLIRYPCWNFRVDNAVARTTSHLQSVSWLYHCYSNYAWPCTNIETRFRSTECDCCRRTTRDLLRHGKPFQVDESTHQDCAIEAGQERAHKSFARVNEVGTVLPAWYRVATCWATFGVSSQPLMCWCRLESDAVGWRHHRGVIGWCAVLLESLAV